MIAVCEVTNIEKEQEITFTDNNGNEVKHRLQQVWCKSSDEEAQGGWTTIAKLWNTQIDDMAELGLKVGSTVSLSVTPTYCKSKKINDFVATVIIKILGVA